MSPGALNTFAVKRSPVKQLKLNYTILSPSNYFSKTKQYFLKYISTEAETNIHYWQQSDLGTHYSQLLLVGVFWHLYSYERKMGKLVYFQLL